MNYIFDTFTNFLSGLGVPGRDKMTGTSYVTTTWTRDQLEASFRGDWIARKAISIPAHDATREWRAWQAEQPQIEKLEETEQRLQVQLKLQQALTKARLYGGCCLLIGVDGSMEKELDPDTIKKDGLKFIHVLAPHQLTIEELIKDLEDPYYGQPTFYRLVDETKKFGDAKIHPSRMVRLLGLDPPDPMKNSGWGDPLMQMIHDAVNSAGTVASSVATLISEAKLDVIKIPGLTEIFSTTNGTNRLIKRFTEANVAKSVINGIIMDAEEEWQRIGVNFAGMPEILQMYLQIAAGAADIPMTRFAGMSPAGLNSTGESDLANYYDRISSDQELRLTPALEKLDKAIVRSALGKSDDNIFYEWNSLWQMTDKEKAEIAKQKADTAMVDVNSGLIPPEALMKGRVNQLIEDGTYPGLEAAIEEALAAQELLEEEEQKLLPSPDRMAWMNEDPGGPGKDEGMGSGPPGSQKKKAGVARDSVSPFGMRLRTLLREQLRTQLQSMLQDRAWEEEKHPRDDEGKFTFGSGALGSPVEKGGLDLRPGQPMRSQSGYVTVNSGSKHEREVEVFVNPSAGTVKRIASESTTKTALGKPEKSVRAVRDEAGNIYVWRAEDALHNEVTQGLNELGVKDNAENTQWWLHEGKLGGEFARSGTGLHEYHQKESAEWIGVGQENAKSVEPLAGEEVETPWDKVMTREELKRFNELEERYRELTEAEKAEYAELVPKFEKRWEIANATFAERDKLKEAEERKASIKKQAAAVANTLGFDESRIDVVSGTRTFDVNGVAHVAGGDADIYGFENLPGRIRLYADHLHGADAVAGVTAHEIEHFKFQYAINRHRIEADEIRAEPGPPPDPNHQYWWGRKGGPDAVLTPSDDVRAPYAVKYPDYVEMHKAMYAPLRNDFAEGDGVSRYSAEYWKAYHDGKVSFEIAMHETMAEMAKAKFMTGKFPPHFGYSAIINERQQTKSTVEGNSEDFPPKLPAAQKAKGEKVWRNLYRVVDRMYKHRNAGRSL